MSKYFFTKSIDKIVKVWYNNGTFKESEVKPMAEKKSTKALHEELRAKYMAMVATLMEQSGEEVLRTASNEIAIPCVDSEGNDEYLVITFKVPTGSRDGDAYDGYAMAEDYAMKCRANAEKAEEAAKKKAAKIAKDKAMREQKAQAKADRAKNTEGT
jgi:hypothetical protein